MHLLSGQPIKSEPYPDLMFLVEPLLARLELLFPPVLGQELDLVLEQLHLLLQALAEALQVLLLLGADLLRCHLIRYSISIKHVRNMRNN